VVDGAGVLTSEHDRLDRVGRPDHEITAHVEPFRQHLGLEALELIVHELEQPGGAAPDPDLVAPTRDAVEHVLVLEQFLPAVHATQQVAVGAARVHLVLRHDEHVRQIAVGRTGARAEPGAVPASNPLCAPRATDGGAGSL